MKKNIGLIALLLVALAVTLVACSPESSQLKVLDKQGIAAYNLTEKERAILNAMGIKNQDIQLLSFNAPSEAKGIIAKVYRLGDNKAWEEIDRMSVSFTEQASVVDSKGTISMNFSKDNAINFVVATDTGLVEYETKGIQSNGDYTSAVWSYLQDANGVLDIESNKEIPVCIASYNNEYGPMGLSMQSFFDTSAFENTDFVQAVTVIFTDKPE